MTTHHSNPYLLTLPQLMSAKKKIGKVAAFYDPTKVSLSGFSSSSLDATQFREQLRRNIGVNVTNAELGALVYLFDKTGERVVDSSTFTNEFFRLGKQERQKFTISHKEEKAKIQEHFRQQRELKAKRFEQLTSSRIATSWTPEQEKSAIKKIARVAFVYDSHKGGLKGFDSCIYVTPKEFKELMRRNFEVYLTPEETGALANMFDRDNTGNINCKEFMYQFFRIGRNERDYHFSKQQELTYARWELEQERREAVKEKFGKLVIATIRDATEEDKRTAFEKIKHAALCFKADSAFSSNLWKSFESEELTPTEFRELLKTNFDIYLTPGELDAVVKMFDVNSDGGISCVEFMTTFFRIGMRERTEINQRKREFEYRTKMEEEARREKLREKAANSVKTRVEWPDLPDENGNMISGNYPESAAGGSRLNSPTSAPPSSSASNRSQSKPSMASILSPNKRGKGVSSIADAYPKASKETRDFIRELELKEKAIRVMKNPSSSDASSSLLKGKTSKKKGVRVAEEEIEDLGNLADRNWEQSAAGGAHIFKGQEEEYPSRPGTSAASSRKQVEQRDFPASVIDEEVE